MIFPFGAFGKLHNSLAHDLISGGVPCASGSCPTTSFSTGRTERRAASRSGPSSTPSTSCPRPRVRREHTCVTSAVSKVEEHLSNNQANLRRLCSFQMGASIYYFRIIFGILDPPFIRILGILSVLSFANLGSFSPRCECNKWIAPIVNQHHR